MWPRNKTKIGKNNVFYCVWEETQMFGHRRTTKHTHWIIHCLTAMPHTRTYTYTHAHMSCHKIRFVCATWRHNFYSYVKRWHSHVDRHCEQWQTMRFVFNGCLWFALYSMYSRNVFFRRIAFIPMNDTILVNAWHFGSHQHRTRKTGNIVAGHGRNPNISKFV